MKIDLTPVEQTVLYLLMKDFEAAAKKQNNRPQRRYFAKMKEKFAPNAMIVSINPYELTSLANAIQDLNTAIVEYGQKNKLEGEEANNAKLNAEIVAELSVKLENKIQDAK
jgi:hypothetical protein